MSLLVVTYVSRASGGYCNPNLPESMQSGVPGRSVLVLCLLEALFRSLLHNGICCKHPRDSTAKSTPCVAQGARLSFFPRTGRGFLRAIYNVLLVSQACLVSSPCNLATLWLAMRPYGHRAQYFSAVDVAQVLRLELVTLLLDSSSRSA